MLKSNLKKTNSYQLRTDALGRKGLDLQGKLYNPGSENFLLAQGIKKGNRCWKWVAAQDLWPYG